VPLDFKISHDDQIVHAVAVGEVSADEIQAFLGSIIADQAMQYGKLFDISQITRLADADRLSEVGDTIRLYDKMKLGPMGPLAIVTGSALQRISYAQTFLATATAQRAVRIFNHSEEAIAWLRARRDQKSCQQRTAPGTRKPAK
jgi:hypothetical protein